MLYVVSDMPRTVDVYVQRPAIYRYNQVPITSDAMDQMYNS
jgi:hypothetical protein